MTRYTIFQDNHKQNGKFVLPVKEKDTFRGKMTKGIDALSVMAKVGKISIKH